MYIYTHKYAYIYVYIYIYMYLYIFSLDAPMSFLNKDMPPRPPIITPRIRFLQFSLREVGEQRAWVGIKKSLELKARTLELSCRSVRKWLAGQAKVPLAVTWVHPALGL